MGRAPFDLPALPLVDGETRQAWVYRLLREAILQGTLKAGMRVPSSRALAQRLSVARSTVEVAFDQLRAEGYVAGVVGSGTYVNATLPDQFLRPERSARAAKAMPTPVPMPSSTPMSAPMPLSMSSKAPRSATARPTRHDVTFVARVADAALFPLAEWRSHLQAAARGTQLRASAEDDAFGAWELRTEVARYLGAARGMACDPAQVIVVAGIRQGLNLAARVLLRATDKVLIEDPGYSLAADIFAPFARRLAAVAIDDAGFSVARARRHAGVRLAHVTPAHQSPTGVTMPVSRRLELLSWARERSVWLLEDDYDSEFNYRSAPLPALKSLDKDDRVLHCGSFNKTMFADLRIGYAVVPRALVPDFAAACRAMGPSVGLIEQRALATFIADGGLARHIRRTRAVYARRRERMLGTLRRAVAPAPLRTSGEHGGFHFTWWLPEDVPADALVEAAAERGLRLELVAEFCQRVRAAPGVLLGDSALGEASLDDALPRLEAAIAAARQSGRQARPRRP
ncbi:PLP-dependent aminotransferase family protein [Roseateles chitinivorans]|uniref:MocR-like pyridoxine biosynthesis transcription factor PdxR n=1 Tax=Roseateles chitinivorans TaxID=2917965 RepID=UPI003D669045